MSNALDNEQIKGFFEMYRKKLFTRWTECPSPEGREELFRLNLTLDAFETHLREYIVNDKIVEFRDERDSGHG